MIPDKVKKYLWGVLFLAIMKATVIYMNHKNREKEAASAESAGEETPQEQRSQKSNIEILPNGGINISQ
ncbi:hypothetical protein EBX31_04950 [bacterium]|nr:hypothetical protein [bacterium]